MARKRARLTLKKKSEKKKEKQAPTGISAQTFANLAHQYKSFIVEDSNHEEIIFSRGEMAYIQYQDLEDDVVVPEEDYWIGTIQEIRADNSEDVWVRVQWFWSPQEVAEVIKSFDPTICSKYEKLSSDSSDIISVHCFVRHVNVKIFDEKSISQVAIGQDEWIFSPTNSVSVLDTATQPKVTHAACPICKVPYTPGLRVENVHHFCPRPSCRNFYHQSCLVKCGYVEKTRTRRVLETWPDIDRTEPVEALCRDCPPRKRRKTEHEDDPLQSFPAQLIAVAQQQILRGTQAGGIVGNVSPVTAARQLIFRTLSQGDPFPTGWATSVDTSLAFLCSETLPNCICPNCYSPI